ncbi:FMN-binding negative transcriptional regulator [Roseiterribacter gracilis]|uniref:Negative transcriptional regulator n=1 Tax=Roseiterribacter gracilis TaxID=2812848 RepID=A0A8S8XAL0_9PROT|nr:negative transcriptional regulator [Rhodospirillales bacterium TMPK1]
MYLPGHFKVEDKGAIHDAMRAYPFATLVTNGADGPFASHLPLLLDGDEGEFGTLLGHVAKANRHGRVPDSDEGVALVIFHGPQTYISPSWYESKREHGKVVPTWNYVAIHAYARIERFDDPVRLHGVLTRLTDRHEAGAKEPWKVTDAPDAFIQQQMKAITGLSLRIERIEAKLKLSQNRPEADRRAMVDGLSQSDQPGDRAVADAMQRVLRD